MQPKIQFSVASARGTHTSCYFCDSLGSGTIPYKSAVSGGRPSRSTKFCSFFCGRTAPSIQSSNSPRAVRKSIKIRNLDDNFAGAAAQVKIGPFRRTFSSQVLLQIGPGKVLQVASGHPVLTQEQRLENRSSSRQDQRSQVPTKQTTINSLSLAKHYIRYP